jgi:5-carboxyvanillate decarboxylase
MKKIDFSQKFKRIATEEAWAPADMLNRWRKLLDDKTFNDPGFIAMWGFFLTQNVGYTNGILDKLTDIGENRIADMDATGIDRQLLLITAPAVQAFRDPAEALEVAISSNDEVAEACRKYPDRFSALAAVPPQDPAAAAKEIDRAMNRLGLNGVVINSHTHGEYLDDPKFWSIFEAAEALDAAIYIHPQSPPPNMVTEFAKRGLEGAVMGFQVDVAMHAVALILSGVFDRFPKLKLVIGHGGEGLPFWLFRLDYQQKVILENRGYKLKHPISEYLKRNVFMTTSGMGWEPAILFCQQVMGVDNILYAMDYPYEFNSEEVIATDNLPISDADKLKLYQTNAERVFNLKG